MSYDRRPPYPPARGGRGDPYDRPPAPRTVLFVANFPPDMPARELAYEFERIGPLVRCDIPAPKGSGARTAFAFVEYQDARDAYAAHEELHGIQFGRYALSIQFAKNAPSAQWRFDEPGAPPRPGPSRRGPPPPENPYDSRRDFPDRRRDDRPPRREEPYARGYKDEEHPRRRDYANGSDRPPRLDREADRNGRDPRGRYEEEDRRRERSPAREDRRRNTRSPARERREEYPEPSVSSLRVLTGLQD
ncbi:RNA-binding domain-containing protein [Ceraceosorus guamensis]|uniref:RNA-binding domain-containing protein n=1 Tax=Ceraceosorus guamensis TaxID=1522189 RepID=A0A316W8J3_9BASI|nr:RNA-binding domain-containing protein [Ceraceosorus guamensis]PWN45874.1 RNA-binding domain-containing protein [Ceraceosorus guamensis]